MAFSPLRVMFLVTLAICVITGIVALAIDPTVRNVQNPQQGAYVAFNVIGTIAFALAMVLLLLVMTVLSDHYKATMIGIIVTVVIGMISFAISVGITGHIISIPPIAWMMAALWVGVVTVIISFVFLCSDPENI